MRWPLILLLPFLLYCGQASTKKTIDEENTEVSNAFIGHYEIDSLFSQNKDSLSYYYEDLWAAVKIGFLFSKENKDAILRYYPNDSTAQIIILRQSGAKWDTIFSEMISPVRLSPASNIITVKDFNGDHMPDLKVVRESWDNHFGEYSDLWLCRNNQFTKVKDFKQIVSAQYEEKTGLIFSYQSAGCADMDMLFGTYRIVADTVQTIDFRNCGCCDPKDSCVIDISGKQSFKVPYKSAYKFVPEFFADAVKEKLEM